MKISNILITGRPGVGKTTLIGEIIRELDLRPAGFFTREIRERGIRVGFEINALTPGLPRMKGILARIGWPGPYRVGRYGVNRKDMEEVGARALEDALDLSRLVIIDEIGNMEIISRRFQAAVLAALESRLPVLGVIKAGRGPFVDRIKARSDVEIIELTRRRYEIVKSIVTEKIRDWGLNRKDTIFFSEKKI